MSPRAVRLILKQFRFELTVIVGVLLACGVVGLVVIGWLPGLRADLAACDEGYQCIGIQDAVGRMEAVGGLVSAVASAIGAFGSVVLGVAVVGREVERGTAVLAWPLARSRRRWLFARATLIGVVVAIAALFATMVGDALVPVLRPGNASATTFINWELRGLLPIGRDLAAFGLGVLGGAVLGRVLPGLLVALLLAVIAVQVGGLGIQQWRAADGAEIAIDNPGDGSTYDVNLILESRFRDESGAIYTWNEVFMNVPSGELPPGWPDLVYEQVWWGIPGARHQEIDRREAALWSVLGLLLVAGSAFVVERRRPY